MAQELHKYTVQESNNLTLGQGGVFTVSNTDIHYGRFVRIQCVTNTVFNTLTEEGTSCNGFAFTSGSVEPVKGALIVGNTSGATAVVVAVTVTSGSFSTSNAVGHIEIDPVSGSFSASETITIKAGTSVVSSDAMTTATAANGGSTAASSITGSSIPAGTVLDGVFTAIKLTSGIVRGYRG